MLVHTRAFPTSIVLGQVNGLVHSGAENGVSECECEVSFPPYPGPMDHGCPRTVILAMAVGAVLIKESFYKSFVIIFCLFLGPSLSIGGELQKARGQDAALRNTEGNYQLKGVRFDAVWLRFDEDE